MLMFIDLHVIIWYNNLTINSQGLSWYIKTWLQTVIVKTVNFVYKESFKIILRITGLSITLDQES